MKKATLYLFVAALLFLPLAFWYTTLFPDLPAAIYVYSAGRLMALEGFVLILIQFVLSSRIKWIERGIGLDALFRIHRKIGQVGIALVLAHPLVLYLSDLLFGLSLRFSWRRLIGLAALALLSVSVALALWYRRWGLKYEVWRTIHVVNYVALPLALVHSLLIGSDLSTGLLRWYWYLLGAVYVLVLAHRIWMRRRLRRRPYAVASVFKETDDTCTLCFDGPQIPHRPGQFLFVQLERSGRVSEAHPFTIASSPGADRICITVKAVGDFTSTISETTVADRAYIDAPYGVFTMAENGTNEVVFIAGGIGVTPFLSMLRHMRERRLERNVLMLWGNKTEADIACHDELEAMVATMPNLRVVHAMSRQPDYQGETGYINADLISCYVQNLRTAEYFVCGPPVMMRRVVANLRELGVPRSRIHYELFAL